MGGSDLLLEFDYSYRCVSFLRPNSDMKTKSGPYKGHNFQKIIILKHDFNCSYSPIEEFILIFYPTQTMKVH